MLWLTAWYFQYYYARRGAYAIYEKLGEGAWNKGDVFFHAFIGFFTAPTLLTLVLLDHNSQKNIIDAYYGNEETRKRVSGARKVLDKEIAKRLQADLIRVTDEKEAIEEELMQIQGVVEKLKKDNGNLREYTKGITRFDDMDFED